MSNKLNTYLAKLDSCPDTGALKTNIQNTLLQLKSFHSTKVDKVDVSPELKPKIIRAKSVDTNPRTDQWTLKGRYQDYYQSEVALFIAEYIQNSKLQSTNSISSLKLRSVVEKISDYIDENIIGDCNLEHYNALKDAGIQVTDDEVKIDIFEGEFYKNVCALLQLMSLYKFLSKYSYVTTLDCPNENLAFELFQSLNATGTPLTAVEIFKPFVVRYLGSSYDSSNSKKYFDDIDQFFDDQKTAPDKLDLTKRFLQSLALPFNGKLLSDRFAEQRDWLQSTYENCSAQQKELLVKWMRDLSKYYKLYIQKRRPNKNSVAFPLVSDLMNNFLLPPDADLAALCIYYLRDAGHSMSHYVISLFYSNLITISQKAGANPNDQGTQADAARAAVEFLQVCKAIVAFYTLWMSASTKYPDEKYRELFEQTNTINISMLSGQANQNLTIIKNHLKAALESEGLYDLNSPATAKTKWKSKALNMLGYGKKTVCRFALFISAHDKVSDPNTGNEGLMINGQPASAPYLTCSKWYSDDFEVIEHIANRADPKTVNGTNPPAYNYLSTSDPALYPGNSSVVDKIGNLTLLSRSVNSSVYAEWFDKVIFYASLTSLNPTTAANIGHLQHQYGVTTLPPSLTRLAASSNYISHLAPIVVRADRGQPWNKQFVDDRTDRICELLFDELNGWLL